MTPGHRSPPPWPWLAGWTRYRPAWDRARPPGRPRAGPRSAGRASPARRPRHRKAAAGAWSAGLGEPTALGAARRTHRCPRLETTLVPSAERQGSLASAGPAGGEGSAPSPKGRGSGGERQTLYG